MRKILTLLFSMMLTICKLYATDGYVKVTSSNNTVSWVKIKLDYKYNGNEYKVSSDAIDKNTEGAVDLDNVWSESGGTGKQYIIIELDYFAFYGCSQITSVKCNTMSFVSIYGQAFQECTSLVSVSIPYAQSLGNSAFSGCSSLTSVTLNRIYRIDSGAFSYCTALTSFNIPASVRIIEQNAFRGCKSLINLTIDSSNKYFTIDQGVIYSKDLTTLQVYLPSNSETTFAVPASVTKIANYAFSDDRNLSTVILRNGVQTIGSSAFSNSNIQSVYLPSSITNIGSYAFNNCNNLVSVKTAMSVPISITNDVFSNAGKATLYVPHGSKNAYQNAANWSSFNKIEEYPVPSVINFADATVKEICVSNWDYNGDGELDEDEAKEVTALGTQFQGNTGIVSFDELVYFSNLQTIGASAFSGCTNLSSINVPSSVTYIGSNAFYNTAWLNNQPDGLIYIGNALYAYKGTMPANTSIVVKAGTTCICDNAFNNYSNLTNIELPNSLTRIGEYAFGSCRGLKSISVPNGVKAIERYSFYYSGLTTVELPEGLESIGNSSFRNCSALQSIVIPNRVTSIGKNTFRSCTQLKSVTMPYYLQTVATDAFRDCSQLQEVHISNLGAWCNVDFEDYRANPLTFAHHLYLNGNEIVELEIPANDYNGSGYSYDGQWSGNWYYDMTTVKPLVFNGCSAIKSIVIPKKITSIGANAFSGCTSLSSVKVEYTPFELNASAFPTRTNVSLYTLADYLSQYKNASVWNTFKVIKAYPNADVNSDQNVDVVDIVDIVRYIKGNPSNSFDHFLADLNSDKVIDLNDAKQELNTVSYSTVLTTILPESGEQPNTIKVGNFEVRARKTCSVGILLENTSDKLVGFQMDIALPDGLSLSSNLCRLSNRIADEEQTLTVRSLGNNTYRFTSVSLTLQPISGNNGELITLSLDATNLTTSGNITVGNIRLVTENSERIVMPNTEFEVLPVEYLRFSGGDGTENNPYLILDPNDFINLANDVNGGTSYEGIFFKVGKPVIDFDGVSYTAIGKSEYVSNKEVISAFSGTFDGNNVTLKNLSTNKALFGYIGKNGVVANIIMDESCKINGTTSDVAGIAGSNKGIIDNCINKASVLCTKYHVAGICGDNMGTITHCKNYGDIVCTSSDAFMIGGIAGDLDGGKIQYCDNYGNVSGESFGIGGVAGLVLGKNYSIDNCTNTGDVLGYYSVGGVIGEMFSASSVSISNNMVTACTITVTSTSNSNGGGAIGKVSNGQDNFYTQDVILRRANTIYDGLTPRGVWDNNEPKDVEENNGAVLLKSGDANRDNRVNVTDIMAVANYILKIASNRFNEKAADVNSDSRINVTDIMGIANIILTGSANGNPAAARSNRQEETDEKEPQ